MANYPSWHVSYGSWSCENVFVFPHDRRANGSWHNRVILASVGVPDGIYRAHIALRVPSGLYQARIACISGLMPMIFITRVRL